MRDFLKDHSIQIFRILVAIILVGKISNWFLDYSDRINNILSAALFCLIGIGYLVCAWAFNKKMMKILFLGCGLYLIGMNFFTSSTLLGLIGILSIVVPIIMVRVLPEEAEKEGEFIE